MPATQAYSSQGTVLQVSVPASPPNFVTVGQTRGLTGPSVTWTIDDITTLTSPGNFKEKFPLMKDPMSVSFTLVYDSSSANVGIDYLRASNMATYGVLERFRIVTSALVPRTIGFYAYVTKFAFKHETNKVAEVDVELTLSGPVTFG